MSTEKVQTAAEIFSLQAELLFKHNLNISERCFYAIGEVNMKLLKHIDACLSILEHQNRRTITLKLSSEGGEVDAALAIVARLRQSPCNIIVEGHGYIASAATLILAAGHKRRFSRIGYYMFHEGSYALEGRHSALEAALEHFTRLETVWCELMAERSSMSAAEWASLGRFKDAYMMPAELLEQGIVEELF